MLPRFLALAGVASAGWSTSAQVDSATVRTMTDRSPVTTIMNHRRVSAVSFVMSIDQSSSVYSPPSVIQSPSSSSSSLFSYYHYIGTSPCASRSMLSILHRRPSFLRNFTGILFLSAFPRTVGLRLHSCENGSKVPHIIHEHGTAGNPSPRALLPSF